MTCKDCLHFMPCGGASWETLTDCPEFTPRNEWVHLPCKDGDRVFSIVVFCGETTIVADRVSGFIIVGDTVSVITNWYLDGGTWGYNIFPTQEEAEKALEERSKHHE